MEFEWDEQKYKINLEVHEVSFEAAMEIWSDPLLEREDDRKDYGEIRIIAYGVAQDRILTVVYTMRGERIRIISARRANRNERKAYHQAFTDGRSGQD